MYFLQQLIDGLCSNDLYHLSMPVLALQLFISKEIIDHTATVKLVRLRSSAISMNCNDDHLTLFQATKLVPTVTIDHLCKTPRV